LVLRVRFRYGNFPKGPWRLSADAASYLAVCGPKYHVFMFALRRP